jgi:hypothetical protein
MTKSRMFLYATLAMIVAFAAFGQIAAAADLTPHVIRLGPAMNFPHHGASPNADPGASLAGGVWANAMGSDWPTFCPASPGCTSDPAGTIFIGDPQQYWSLSGCTDAYCMEVADIVETGSASGTWTVDLIIKQGSNKIADSGLQTVNGTVSPNSVNLIYFSEVGFPACPKGVTCVNPVAGPAVISFTNTIGGVKTTATRIIYLQ